MSLLSFTRTRIAPTPSGYLHTGNAMSFLITAALAKKAGAKLLLRIDDMDKERVRKEYVEDIFDTLHFLDIDWQEGPENSNDFERFYSQIHRIKLYEETLQQLREDGLVFACRCSRAQLQKGNECACRGREISLDTPFVSWRLITDEKLPLTVLTLHGEHIVASLPASVKSFVVRKKDGLPAYQLSSLVDDEHFRVDAVVRGEDLWHSTLAQQYLAGVLRKPFFENVCFYHHPLLKDAGGNKLSKSAGAASLRQWRQQGKTKEDVLQFIYEQMVLPADVKMFTEWLE